ncbi:MAG: adenylyltransferase/cytidyltransferase family protein [Thermoproteales archaeon]|nr:adenylyltransferase/cytidyltransferase family protein [Thermoproteales archaeon]RLE67208.1 MAG: hypothetical protein DRJ47_00710 [Thermoprotei archaeon]
MSFKRRCWIIKWSNALYCGRFQPPHQGHLNSVKYGLKLAEKVYVGIRATPLSLKDPLTPEERVEAWIRLLKSEGIAEKVVIKIIPDFGKETELPREDKVVLKGHPLLEWGRKVEEIFGTSPEDTVFIGNKPSMVLAFNLLGYIVVPGHRNVHRLVDVSASQLRQMILNEDKEWMKLLPKPITEYLLEIKIKERLESLIGTGDISTG